MERYAQTVTEYKQNKPLVEVEQIWYAVNETGDVIRKLRILAEYPELDSNGKRQWIYEELYAKWGVSKHIGVCPEFNLRYVFTLSKGEV